MRCIRSRCFCKGVYAFEGRELLQPFLLTPELSYTVAADRRGQLTYVRADNSTEVLIYLLLMRGGAPMRYFPVGAKSETHVALTIVEDLAPDTRFEVFLAAPEGVKGIVVVDIGLIEV